MKLIEKQMAENKGTEGAIVITWSRLEDPNKPYKRSLYRFFLGFTYVWKQRYDEVAMKDLFFLALPYNQGYLGVGISTDMAAELDHKLRDQMVEEIGRILVDPLVPQRTT